MKYQTAPFTQKIEDLTINIERVTNIDELYDQLIAKGENHEDFKDERIPYWAEIWPSALAMSHYIVKEKDHFKNKKIIEIGAGLGFPSIVAGKIGAQMTITDYLPEAVDFAKQNWNKNNSHAANFQTLDWRSPNQAEQYDIVLAADIAYETRTFQFLPAAFKALCKPNGFILLTEPNRTLAQPFLSDLSKEGFNIQKEIMPITLFDIPYKINVLKITIL